MSLIVAIKDKNRFLVGCDTRATQGAFYSDGYALTKKARMLDNSKGLIVAGVGSSAVCDFAEIVLKKHNIDKLDREYILEKFWPEFYQRCYKYSAMNEDEIDGELMILMKDKGFYIDGCGGIMEILETCSIGSGAEISDAILHSLSYNKSYCNYAKILSCIDAAGAVRNDISQEIYIGSTDGKDFTKYHLTIK